MTKLIGGERAERRDTLRDSCWRDSEGVEKEEISGEVGGMGGISGEG